MVSAQNVGFHGVMVFTRRGSRIGVSRFVSRHSALALFINVFQGWASSIQDTARRRSCPCSQAITARPSAMKHVTWGQRFLKNISALLNDHVAEYQQLRIALNNFWQFRRIQRCPYWTQVLLTRSQESQVMGQYECVAQLFASRRIRSKGISLNISVIYL